MFSELCKVNASLLLITFYLHSFLVLYFQEFVFQICDGDAPYRTLDDLTVGHKNFREKAVDLFKKKKKVGANEMSSLFLKNLENEMEVMY